MRVLWFTNTPSLAKKKLNVNITGGGWIEELENLVRDSDRIELVVSFYNLTNTTNEIKCLDENYYILPKYKNKLKKMIERKFSIIENEEFEIKNYLKIIDEFKPDIINIFGTENPFGLIIPNTSVPVIIHLQGLLNPIYKKWYSGFSREEINKEYTIVDKLLSRTNYDYYKLFKEKLEENSRFFQMLNT